MQLVLKGGVAGQERPVRPPAAAAVYRCPHDGGERDTPGPCPKCGMALGEEHQAPKAPARARTIYVCDLHPEEVFDRPGECNKDG